MELTPVERMQLKNQVERILHIQGNYTGGILEIAVVLDYDMPLPVLREKAAGILKALKLQGEVFRNIRLNVVKWISDECIVKEVSSAFDVQTGRVFEDYEACQEQKKTSQKSPETETPKSLDGLAGQLKLFYARSKLILILTEEVTVFRMFVSFVKPCSLSCIGKCCSFLPDRLRPGRGCFFNQIHNGVDGI